MSYVTVCACVWASEIRHVLVFMATYLELLRKNCTDVGQDRKV
jgi:hypothetical protein